MQRVLRILRNCLLSVAALVAVAGALFGWFLYSPAAEVPQLPGTVAKGAIEAGGLTRTYQTYLPKGLEKGAPLLLVMHGSGQSGADIRAETGYGFERLAVWRNGGRAEVELVTIQGGGHGMPQSAWRRPRLLGPSPMAPDGPAMIWSFFARQRS